MKVIKKIVMWLVTVFFVLLTLFAWIGTRSFGIVSISCALISLLLWPTNKWQEILRKRIHKKWIIIVMLIVVMFAGIINEGMKSEDVTVDSMQGTDVQSEPSNSPSTETTAEPTATTNPTAGLPVKSTATAKPTEAPTVKPTATAKPTEVPTVKPTATAKPTEVPTVKPTATAKPTEAPTVKPTATAKPTEAPTVKPTATAKPTEAPTAEPELEEYVLNTNSKRFHEPSCGSVDEMAEKNRKDYVGTREELIERGYKPCGNCEP